MPDLTIEQNLRLTGTPVDAVRRHLRELDLEVDLGEHALDVPLPLLRMIDLARALARDPQLLILDEITAALPSDLAERVFDVMRRQKERGRSALFITHRLREVIAHCDRATVLRDGEDVGTLVPQEGGEEKIVEFMLGPEVAQAAGRADATAPRERIEVAANAPSALEVSGLQVADTLTDVSFVLRPGEILGIAALEGQGQDELFGVLSGQRRQTNGDVVVRGRPLRARHPYDAIRSGLVLVPADRLLLALAAVQAGLPPDEALAGWYALDGGSHVLVTHRSERRDAPLRLRAALLRPALPRRTAASAGGGKPEQDELRTRGRARRAAPSPGSRVERARRPRAAVRRATTCSATRRRRCASGAGDVELCGLLMLPRAGGEHAGVVMIPQGSGDSDRDNVWAFSIANHLARARARGAAARQARLRASRRGDWKVAGFEDLAGDALAGPRRVSAPDRAEVRPAPRRPRRPQPGRLDRAARGGARRARGLRRSPSAPRR